MSEFGPSKVSITGSLDVDGDIDLGSGDDDVDLDTGTLFVDASDNKVGIGTETPRTLLTVEGAITLKEQSAADSDTAAYGQLWCKTATPNQLYYTTDAGDDIQLTSGTSAAGGGGGDPDWDDENNIVANMMLGG